MDEKKIIEGFYDEDGKELHELDHVMYNGEEYIILSQDDENTPIVLHPIGSNPHNFDVALSMVNYATQLID